MMRGDRTNRQQNPQSGIIITNTKTITPIIKIVPIPTIRMGQEITKHNKILPKIMSGVILHDSNNTNLEVFYDTYNKYE